MQLEARFLYSDLEMEAAAARLDAAIEMSALCMDLALAGKLQRAVESASVTEDLRTP